MGAFKGLTETVSGLLSFLHVLLLAVSPHKCTINTNRSIHRPILPSGSAKSVFGNVSISKDANFPAKRYATGAEEPLE